MPPLSVYTLLYLCPVRLSSHLSSSTTRYPPSDDDAMPYPYQEHSRLHLHLCSKHTLTASKTYRTLRRISAPAARPLA